MRLLGFSLLSAATLGAGIVAFQVMDSDAKDRDTAIASMDSVVVAELFTSQGCSSCPPADAVAAKLAENQNIVVISRPVTYWDRLGWKDTLAREDNTRLQRSYATKGLTNSGVYTPQMVINGRTAAIGSREYEVRDMIMSEMKVDNGVSLNVESTDEGGFTLSLNGNLDAVANVILIALDSEETVQVGRGENGGRKLTYTNVLRNEERLGTLNGGREEFSVAETDMQVNKADRYAVIVQEANAGQILAASYL